jgi:hypothetical protein
MAPAGQIEEQDRPWGQFAGQNQTYADARNVVKMGLLECQARPNQ